MVSSAALLATPAQIDLAETNRRVLTGAGRQRKDGSETASTRTSIDANENSSAGV